MYLISKSLIDMAIRFSNKEGGRGGGSALIVYFTDVIKTVLSITLTLHNRRAGTKS